MNSQRRGKVQILGYTLVIELDTPQVHGVSAVLDPGFFSMQSFKFFVIKEVQELLIIPAVLLR